MPSVVEGLPILLVAFLGGAIHRLVPNICSFTDFTYRRFGPFVQVDTMPAMPAVSCHHASVTCLCKQHAYGPMCAHLRCRFLSVTAQLVSLLTSCFCVSPHLSLVVVDSFATA